MPFNDNSPVAARELDRLLAEFARLSSEADREAFKQHARQQMAEESFVLLMARLDTSENTIAGAGSDTASLLAKGGARDQETIQLPGAASTVSHPEPNGTADDLTSGNVADEWATQNPLRDEDATLDSRSARPPIENSKLRVVGDYQILEEIARGGMGVVYKARQRKLNRVVAIKMILAGSFASADDVKRFQSEAEAAARLDHVGIVPIYQVDEFENCHYFSMGYVDGKSLHDQVAKGPLPQRRAATIVREVALAVQYAHERGVIHRDLKPRNILIGSDGHPKITDFGLAKCLEGSNEGGLTISGQVLGTPGFMPPEQAAGQQDAIGPRSDIYALGSVLYATLTGRPPFQADNIVETLRQVQETPPVSPRLLNPALDRDLETICLKCLEKAPAHRYATAAEVADELKRYLDGEPIRARRINLATRAARWARRKPAIAALLLSLVILAAVLLGGGRTLSRQLQLRQVAELEGQFDRSLENVALTEDYLSGMEQQAAELNRHNPEVGVGAKQQLYEAFGQKIRAEIRRPKLDDASLTSATAAISLIRSRDEALAAALTSELQSRQRTWQTLLDFSPPFSDAAAVLPAEHYRVNSDKTQVILAPPAGTTRLLTTESAEGLVQLAATFDPSWQDSPSIGLILKAKGAQGYEFRLEATPGRQLADEGQQSAPATDAKTTSFRSLRLTDGQFIVAISRNGQKLLQHRIDQSAAPDGPLRLQASCEQGELRFQINSLPSIVFRDPFPIPADPLAVFGLEAAPNTSLLSLRAWRKPRAETNSPLERGDELYDHGNYADALTQYEQQELATDDPQFAQESKFKQALCLQQLGRIDDAIAMFDAVMSTPGERWPPLAGAHRWLLLLRSKRKEEAGAAFDVLTERFRFDQVGPLIPQDLRDEILASYSSDLNTLSTFMRYNPQLVTNLQRLAAVDRYLSVDGRGDDFTQIDVARGYQLQGDVRSALGVARELYGGTKRNEVVRHYLRLLRLNGEAQLAYQELAKIEQQHKADNRPIDQLLLVERARICASLERWWECEDALESSYQRYRENPTHLPHYLTYYSLMKGLLLERRGAHSQAQAVWSEGYQVMRPQLSRFSTPTTEAVNAIILGSLSDEMTEEEGRQFVGGVLSRGDNAFTRQAQSLTDPSQLGRAVKNMWRTPLGRSCAEDFAFERYTLRDRVKVPTVLAATEYISQVTSGAQMTDEQMQAIYESFGICFDQLMYEGKFSIAQLAQLALSWKGTVNFLGWGGIASTLEPEVRAGVAYMLAHRHLQLGNKAQAIKFLDTVRNDAAKESLLAKLAVTDRRLIEANQGQMFLRSELPETTGLVFTQDGKEVARLDVTPDALDSDISHRIDLPVGDIDISLAQPNDQWRIAPPRINVPLAGGRDVELKWVWKPERDAEPLPGLISHPSISATSRRWQLVFRDAVHRGPRAAFRHDGQRFVTASTDQLLRIYDTASRELVEVCTGGSYPTDVLWPHQDLIVVGSADGSVRGWKPEASAPWFVLHDHRAHITSLAARGTNGDFISSSYSPTKSAILWSRDGFALDQVSGDSGADDADASADGRWVAARTWRTAGYSAVEVTDMSTREKRIITEPRTHGYRHVAFSPDSKWLAAGDSTAWVGVWRTSDWSLVTAIEAEHSHLAGLRWSPDSGRIIIGGEANGLCDYDFTTERATLRRRYPIPRLQTFDVNFSAAQAVVALNDYGFALQPLSDSPAARFGSQTSDFASLAVQPSAQGRVCVIGPFERLYFLGRGGSVEHVSEALGPRVSQLRWNDSGTRLAALLETGDVVVLDADAKVLARHPARAAFRAQGLEWTTDDHLLLSEGSRNIRKLDAVTGAEIVKLATLPIDVAIIARSGAGASVVIDHEGKSLTVGDKGAVPSGLRLEEPKAPYWIDFSPVEDLVAIIRQERNLHVARASGKREFDCEFTYGGYTTARWSPDGKTLAAGTDHGTVALWSRTGELLRQWRSQPGAVRSLAWLDNDRLVTSHEDSSVHFWNVQAPHAATTTVLLPEGNWASFTAGGCLLDGTKFDPWLTCIVENESGSLDLLNYGDLLHRVGVELPSAQQSPPLGEPGAGSSPASFPAAAAEAKEETLPAKQLPPFSDESLLESSGAARASSRLDAFWTHNDSDHGVRLVDFDGGTRACINLADTKPFDWEDMCAFQRDGKSFLLIGDIGDNFARRDDLVLHLVREPEAAEIAESPRSWPVEKSIRFRYEDAAHDCEALAVDSERNVAMLVTKELAVECSLFELPLDQEAGGIGTAKRVARLKIPFVTAMDISPDQNRLSILGGQHVFEYFRNTGEPWLEALQRLPRCYRLPKLPQAEALAYVNEGRNLLVTSEGKGEPLWLLDLPSDPTGVSALPAGERPQE